MIKILICLIIGFIFGEYKTCKELSGSYSWDYGSCQIEVKK